MRLVQRVMLPESDVAHLAEVLLGGLLSIVPGGTGPDEIGTVQYDFLPGVRDELNNYLLRDEMLAVLRETSQFVTERFGQRLDFAALLSDPEGTPLPALVSDDGQPLAYITATTLAKLGGRYRVLADRLGGAIRATPETTISPSLATPSSDPPVSRQTESVIGDVNPATVREDPGGQSTIIPDAAASQTDIRFSAADTQDLRAELASIFNNRRAMERILRSTDFPPERIPAFGTSSPYDMWSEILLELGRGVIPSGNRQLLTAVLRLYPGNLVFRQLAETYLGVATGGDAAWADQSTLSAAPQTCHVIVKADTDEARMQAATTLRELGLDPIEQYSTEHAVSFQVNSDQPARVRALLGQIDLEWTVLPPGMRDYLLHTLSVEGPDDRRFRLTDVPAQQTVGSQIGEIVDHIDENGQSWRLDPNLTLHESGISDGDRLRVGFESVAGGSATGHAFISYAREDSDNVDRLQRALQAVGVRTWRDTADLWPGENWRVRIRRAITDEALVFIACFSSRSLARARSYQNEELALAVEQMRLRPREEQWLIPVRFDECEIPDFDIGGGRSLGSIQRVDLFGDRVNEGLTSLTTAVLRILRTQASIPQADNFTATLRTTLGTIVVRLLPDHAPKTVRNFVELAEGGRQWTDPETGQATTGRLYDGTIFHRVIPDFMIQGGDPLGSGRGGPGYKFGDEIDPDLVFDRPHLLAMANAGPGTNGSQFFITTVPTPWLNGKHTIFGEVIEGADVVDRISRVKTGSQDRPVTDVVLETVEIIRGEIRYEWP